MEEPSVKKTKLGSKRDLTPRFRPAKLQSLSSNPYPDNTALYCLSPRNIPSLFEISQYCIRSSDPVSPRNCFPPRRHRLNRYKVLSQVTVEPWWQLGLGCLGTAVVQLALGCCGLGLRGVQSQMRWIDRNLPMFNPIVSCP